MPVENKQSFSTSEVAAYCHVTPDTIRKWAEAGRIQVFKTPGGHRRIRREDLLKFLNDNNIPVHGDLEIGGTRILVVEQEASVVTVIRRFLERARIAFHVEVAMDAFEAGRKIVSFRPDVVFIDVRLPGIDVFDVIRRIKHGEDTSATRVIALAGSSDADLGMRATDNGAVQSLLKPFTPDDLRRTLARVGVDVS